MPKHIFLFFLFGLLILPVEAQITSVWGQVGGSYISHRDDLGTPLEEIYTLRTAVALDVGEKWSVGMKAHQIYYGGIRPGWEHLWLAGPFARFGFVKTTRGRLYLESGLHLGNYCTCDNGPTGSFYRDDGLLYASMGGGVEFRLWRGLFFDVGFTTHHILNRPRPKFGYNAYFLGFLVRIGEEDE